MKHIHPSINLLCACVRVMDVSLERSIDTSRRTRTGEIQEYSINTGTNHQCQVKEKEETKGRHVSKDKNGIWHYATVNKIPNCTELEYDSDERDETFKEKMDTHHRAEERYFCLKTRPNILNNRQRRKSYCLFFLL